MIGNILGAMEVLGLIGLIINYSGLEKLNDGLYIAWALVIVPIVLAIVLSLK